MQFSFRRDAEAVDNEIKILQRLDHDSIVKYLHCRDILDADGNCIGKQIFMELCNCDLGQVLS